MTAWIALALAGVAETATSCVLRGHLLAAPSGYLCVPEKNGNVAWSLLLLRANNPTAWPSIVASEREQQFFCPRVKKMESREAQGEDLVRG